MEHPENLDVVFANDVENAVATLNQHSEFDVLRLGHDRTRVWVLRKLDGPGCQSLDKRIRIANRCLAVKPVNRGEVCFGRFSPIDFHRLSLKAVALANL